MKALIIGGGVMGLLQARALAHSGWQVTLLDKGDLGREASWAGGGIISPLYPWRYCDAVTALASWSQQAYPDLIRSLHAESGIDPELSPHGLLMLSVADAARALEWAKGQDSWLEEIDQAAALRLEPGLSGGAGSIADREAANASGNSPHGALWMPKVASVRNPRLLHALRKIAHEHPRITVNTDSEAVALTATEVQGPCVTLRSGEQLSADRVVVCSGAWTSQLLPRTRIEVFPVKGQMIVFDAPAGALGRVVLHDGKYLIPRRDGKIVAGSTLEMADFDKTTTDAARQSLREAAINIVPGLAAAKVLHHWAGLRPGSRGGVPFIGPVPEMPGVYVNAGHFRNGLVLAPASVSVMTALLNGAEAPVPVAPYAPDRVVNPSPVSSDDSVVLES